MSSATCWYAGVETRISGPRSAARLHEVAAYRPLEPFRSVVAGSLQSALISATQQVKLTSIR